MQMLITVIATGIHCSLLKEKIMMLGKTHHSSVNGEKTDRQRTDGQPDERPDNNASHCLLLATKAQK